MIGIAWQTLRARWAGFAGTFVALALGGCLVSGTVDVLASNAASPELPRRYSAAPAVVAVDPYLHASHHAQRLAAQPPLPAGVVARVEAVPGARVVEDRVFHAQVAGGSADSVGRPWSAAAAAPYRLVAGRPPRTAGEIVLTGGATPGEVVTVYTARGPAPYTVAGVARPARAAPDETPVFFTDDQAARLSPRVTALAVWPGTAAGAVRRAAGADATVLTGAGRASLEPDVVHRRARTVTGLLAIMTGVATFVSIFVVASTFAYGVAQRRREIALLRMVGGTPRQVRRMLLAEALAVGMLASATGTLLSLPFGGLVGAVMVHYGLAPAGFTVAPRWWPPAVGVGTGLVVALLGVWAASRRARRVRPIEALRDASVDRRVMTASRWIFGLSFLGGGVAMLAGMAAADDTGGRITRVVFASELLIVGVALLGPVLIPPLVRLLTLPLRRLRGPGGLLVREGALAARRRTVATVAPVLVTVGMTASLLGTVGTLNAATAADRRHGLLASSVVVSHGSAGITGSALTALRAVPGATVVATTDTTLFAVGAGTLVSLDAVAVDPVALPNVLDTPVHSGSLAELAAGRDTIAVGAQAAKATGWRAGQRVRIWLADGTEARVRVAAVLADTTAGSATYLPADLVAGHLGTALPDTAYVTGGDPAALARAVAGQGARVIPRAAYTDAADTKDATEMWVLMGLILGIATVYTSISIANTLIMATADRRGEFAALRLAGATPRQVLRFVAAEAATVVLIGGVLGLGIAAVVLLALSGALPDRGGGVAFTMPWSVLGAIAAGCLVLAVVASVLPARAALRARSVDLAGTRG
ncbi:MAG: FtsX-like permease family protein [Mycobacteriales bacterium]